MAIVINGSTGITATESSSVLGDGAVEAADLASGAAASNLGTGNVTASMLASTLDLTGKTVTLPAGVGGKVLQVVSSNQTIARFITTSTTDVYTGFFVNITPSSSSSKILVTYYFTAYSSSAYAAPSLYRNTTKIGSLAVGDAYEGYGSWGSGAFCYLDSPATTSSVDYKIYMQVSGAGTTYFGSSSSTGTENMVRLIAMEIAA